RSRHSKKAYAWEYYCRYDDFCDDSSTRDTTNTKYYTDRLFSYRCCCGTANRFSGYGGNGRRLYLLFKKKRKNNEKTRGRCYSVIITAYRSDYYFKFI